MRRRNIIAAIGGALAWPALAWPQGTKRVPVLGVLGPYLKPSPEAIAESPLQHRLRELGWIEGRTLHVERAFAEYKFDRLPELAAALVGNKVDVILAIGPAAAVAAARATRTIPIVF